MDYIKSEDELLQSIIDTDGDCIKASQCPRCPFAKECVVQAIEVARLLPKETRVRLAYEKLFNKLMENELDNE